MLASERWETAEHAASQSGCRARPRSDTVFDPGMNDLLKLGGFFVKVTSAWYGLQECQARLTNLAPFSVITQSAILPGSTVTTCKASSNGCRSGSCGFCLKRSIANERGQQILSFGTYPASQLSKLASNGAFPPLQACRGFNESCVAPSRS